MDYFIGIDLGTSSTKALAMGSGGESLGVASQAYPAISDMEGQHEEDPDTIFAAFIKVLAQIVHEVPLPYRLAGISFSAAMHGLVALDSNGRPLTRLITWADTRAASVAASFKGTPTAKRIYQSTGTPIHPMSPLCKLLWLKETDPGLFGRAEKFVSIKEYVWYRLFDVFEVDHSIASATGLFDTASLKWSELALQTAAIGPDRLSLPVPVTYQRKGLPLATRERLGLTEDVPFIIGAGDGCLANLGSGVVSPGEASLTIGTSGAVRATTPLWKTDAEQRLFSYLLTDQYYVTGGAINNGGNLLQWFTGLLKPVPLPGQDGRSPGHDSHPSDDLDTLLNRAFALPAGAGGLLFLPYLHGERAPMWDADARGAFIGLRSYHRQEHLLKAVTEGICYALYDIFTILEEVIGPMDIVYASGGFTRTQAWVQQIADLFGKPVRLTEEADASATGAALLGMLALGALSSVTDARQHIKQGKTFYPDPDKHRVYQTCFVLYRSLYAPLRPTFEALDKL
jgi:gluconokinase